MERLTSGWVQAAVSTYATVIAAGGTYTLWSMWQQAGSLRLGVLFYLMLYYVVSAPIVVAVWHGCRPSSIGCSGWSAPHFACSSVLRLVR